MKIIICGAGNVALRVIELLHSKKEKVNVIVLNKEEEYLKKIKKLCSKLIIGNAKYHDILIKAGIKNSDVFMSLTGDEVENIEMCILARELNPKIKIIMRMFDENFSKRIQTGFKINKTLSTSSLSSSSFVSACMNNSILHAFNFEGKMNYIVDYEINIDSPLMDKVAEDIEKSYPIKIITYHEIKQKNGANANRFKVGDRILFSTFEKSIISELDNNDNIIALTKTLIKNKKTSFIDKLTRIPKNIKMIGILYFILIIFSVMVFHFGLKISIIDALYFVITTTTTVGYGDFNLQTAPVLIKIFGCFVMLCGAALLASIFSVVTDSIISKRFNQYFGIGKNRMKNHIVIAGLGNIGYRVLNLLYDSGEKIIAIEQNANTQFLTSLRGRIPVIFGNALHSDTIRVTNIGNAKTVMALTDDDLTNINILLNAKELNPNIKTIGRIFNKNIREKAEDAFGIDSVLSTSYISAPTFVSSAANTKTVYSFFREGELLSLIEIFMKDYSFLNKMSINEIIMRYKLFPFLYKKNNGYSGFIDKDYIIHDDDYIILIGHYEDIKIFPDL